MMISITREIDRNIIGNFLSLFKLSTEIIKIFVWLFLKILVIEFELKTNRLFIRAYRHILLLANRKG